MFRRLCIGGWLLRLEGACRYCSVSALPLGVISCLHFIIESNSLRCQLHVYSSTSEVHSDVRLAISCPDVVEFSTEWYMFFMQLIRQGLHVDLINSVLQLVANSRHIGDSLQHKGDIILILYCCAWRLDPCKLEGVFCLPLHLAHALQLIAKERSIRGHHYALGEIDGVAETKSLSASIQTAASLLFPLEVQIDLESTSEVDDGIVAEDGGLLERVTVVEG